MRAQSQMPPGHADAQDHALNPRRALDIACAIATSEAYLVSHRQRKKVEMLFAHLKRILKLDRLRLRGS
jgi:arginine repressor